MARADLRLRRALHARLCGGGGEARPGLGRGRQRLDPARLAEQLRCCTLYFVVGLLGAAMTPYEVYFYSSGGVEEQWSPKDIGLNRANAIVGYGLGGLLSFALMIVGGTLFLGHGISPEHLGTIALGAEQPFGRLGLLLALIGILFAVGGASIDTVFSGRLQPGSVLRLGVGPLPAARRRAALRAHLDRSARVRAGDRHDWRRSGRAHRVRRDLLGRRPAADLRCRFCSWRTIRPTWASTVTDGSPTRSVCSI